MAVELVTFGCRLNLVESETIERLARAAGLADVAVKPEGGGFAPGAPEARITLSARVLDASEYKHIVIMGDEKRAALEQAQTLTSTAAPVCAILNDTKVHWAP